MDEKERILKYWYNLEFFSPYWPETDKNTQYINTLNNKIPWNIKEKQNCTYKIYLGKMNVQDLIETMLCSIGETSDKIEKETSKSCLCAFKLNSEGKYIGNSFCISNFVWAMGKIVSEKNLNVYFDTKEIDTLNSKMDDLLISKKEQFQYDDLTKLYNIVLEETSLNQKSDIFQAVIIKDAAKIETNDSKKDSYENIIKKINPQTIPRSEIG